MHRVSGLVLIALTLAYLGWRYADALGLRRRPVQPAAPQLAEGPRLEYAPPTSDELWIGPPGIDADGYPLRHVDKVALVSLVRAREFGRAERFMERVQSEFEADQRKEDWVLETAYAFDSADPALAVLLDAWQAQSPNVWQVHLARGMHLKAVAWARRGTKYLNKTSPEQLAGLDESAKLAADSLERAAALRPKLLSAVNALLWLAGATHQTKLDKKEYLDRALDSCPGCTTARETFLDLLHPIWGGSIALVDRYATDLSFTHDNRRLARLSGFGENVRCDVAGRAKRPAEGLPHCDAALRIAPTHIEFLKTRSEVLEDLGRRDEAFRDLTLALEQHPQRTSILRPHSRHLVRQKRYEEAARELITLRLLDPVDPRTGEDSSHVIQGLVYEGHQARVAGDFARAIQLFGAALQLDPQHADAQSRLSEARSAQGGSGEIATLTARLGDRPDDFELRRALDAAYIRTGQLQPIAKMWSDFIATHPQHAGAYFERSGTYYHLKDMEHARADARKACELGLQPACQIAQRFAP